MTLNATERMRRRPAVPLVVTRQPYCHHVEPTGQELMGVSEIAEYLGVSRQRVDALARTKADFPAPAASLQAGRVWRRQEVEAWAKSSGRLR